MSRARRIEDYAVIGDGGTAALVGRDGSIDWLCWPRFDSPACFAALLGTRDHGHWSIAPVAAAHGSRRYRPDTLILETTFSSDEGEVTLTDFMPRRGEASEVVRIVRGVRGRMNLRMELVIRFDYGSILPWVTQKRAGSSGDCSELSAIAGPDRLTLRTRAPLRGENNRTLSDFTVESGDTLSFVLSWSRSHLPPPAALDVGHALEQTESFWKEWAGRCSFEGPWRDAVVRSLITLKSLTYATHRRHRRGCHHVAAGAAGWRAQLGLSISAGCATPPSPCWRSWTPATSKKPAAWRDWLVRALAGAPAQAADHVRARGRAASHGVGSRAGCRDIAKSAPVRIGNAAASTSPSSTSIGEMIDAMHQARRGGLAPAEAAWAVQRALSQHLEKIWREPDEGIWEVRGPRRHFTHSKVMAWVAFDRAIKAAEKFGLEGPLERWRALRQRIHDDVARRASIASWTPSCSPTARSRWMRVC